MTERERILARSAGIWAAAAWLTRTDVVLARERGDLDLAREYEEKAEDFLCLMRIADIDGGAS